MKHDQIVVKDNEGQDVTLTIETGDVLAVANGRGILPRAIKFVTYGKDRKKVALRVHHMGMFLVTATSTIVREMDFCPKTKRLGDQWTMWNDEKYRSGRATDRTLILLKPKEPYTDPMALQSDLESYRGMYAVRRLFGHVWMAITGRMPEQKGDGRVCNEFVAHKLNKHKKHYFDDVQTTTPRSVTEALIDDFDMYILN